MKILTSITLSSVNLSQAFCSLFYNILFCLLNIQICAKFRENPNVSNEQLVFFVFDFDVASRFNYRFIFDRLPCLAFNFPELNEFSRVCMHQYSSNSNCSITDDESPELLALAGTSLRGCCMFRVF